MSLIAQIKQHIEENYPPGTLIAVDPSFFKEEIIVPKKSEPLEDFALNPITDEPKPDIASTIETLKKLFPKRPMMVLTTKNELQLYPDFFAKFREAIDTKVRSCQLFCLDDPLLEKQLQEGNISLILATKSTLSGYKDIKRHSIPLQIIEEIDKLQTFPQLKRVLWQTIQNFAQSS